MAKTYKVLSALLSYPTQELKAAANELRAVLKGEGLLPPALRDRVEALIGEFAAGDLYELQERYVDLFDRGRQLSLHLFEHVHGESRDRGQAMIDLKSLYEKNGLTIRGKELPDFLPLFIEFLATRPLSEARAFLGQTSHILALLCERLQKRNSSYEVVFRALQELASVTQGASEIELVTEAPEADAADDLAVLDAEWEEAAVTFGPEAAPSCKDRLVARIRAARRPAPSPVN
jgi:nitrate reductase delta subunit